MARLWPVLILAILPILPLWRCVVAGEAIGPFNQIRRLAPWNGPEPAEPWDVLQADGVLQFYPWRDMVFKAWSSGKPPFWNHAELGGTPLLANSQSAGFYPPHIVVGLLPIPTAPGMVLLAWGHLFLAGWGVFALCRQLGGSRLGAFVAGASFELSAFMLAWTALPSVISTVAWIPWLLWAIQGVSRSNLRRAAPIAFFAGMMLLAGHLQFAAYGLFAAVLLIVWRATQARSFARLGVMGLGLALGFAIAAPQLIPVLQFGRHAHRRNPPSDAGYAAYLAGAVQPFELANVAYAYTLGSPREPVVVPEGKISAYWPPLVKPGANLAESAMTLGPLILGLLLLVPWRRRRLWPYAAIAGVSLLLALGTPLNWPLYHLVPGWSATGSPGRIIVLFVLGACVLAGTGVRRRPSKTARAGAAVALLSYPALSLLAGSGIGDHSAVEPMMRHALSQALPVGLGLGAITAASLLLAALPRFRSVLAFFPIVLALPYAANLVPTGAPIPIQAPQGFDRVAFINRGWSMILPPQAIAPPNTAYLLGLRELAGYDSLIDADTKRLLDHIDGQDAAPPANGNMMLIKPTADPQLLADAGVTRIAEGTDLDSPGLVSVTGGGGARMIADGPTGSTAEAPGPGRLILRERALPGWSATIDGRAAPLLGRTWLELDLPAGGHRVEFDYRPPGLIPGVLLGVLGWLALVGLLWFRRASSRAPSG